ncbi:MAG: hypothetical protein FRX49_04172 [Trebouxia sp. A1-2]|nr:MAG: hypothetical protein FRX49_04172 [Trebouxia sp. A1-2]
MLNHCTALLANTTWEGFVNGMKQRFGDNTQTILARVTHRKQRRDTNVQSFVDEMNMLYSETSVPGAMKIDIRILIDNLKPALRAQVEATIPKTLEQAVENAVYLEKQAVGAVTDRLKLWEQQHKSNSSDPIERITKFMEKRAPKNRTAFTPEGIQLPGMLVQTVEIQQPVAVALDPPLPEALGQALLPNQLSAITSLAI